MFRSATFRVTLIAVAITMAISVLFSVTIYHFADGAIESSAHRQYLRLRREYTLPPSPRTFPPPPITSTEQSDADHHLLLNLVYLNLIILGVSTVVGSYLAHQTLEPIERAMELQGQFAADASHELRTPLAAMRSEIEVALRGKQFTAAEARTVLTSNLEEIAKLEGLASGLLQLARLESSPGQFGPTSSKAVITSAITGLKTIAKAQHVVISQSGDDLKVLGNHDSLQQVMTILLDNSLKYGKDGGKVKVTTKAAGHKAIITVSDDGPGINEGDLERVFERFWRASAGRTKNQTEGYGLGLAIAREILTLHHGEISAASSAGNGTTFTVELPLA